MTDKSDRPGLMSVLLTLPPALTIVAAASTWLTFGAVGEWLQTYWFPITRALWGQVLALIDWSPPADLVDMLTAILFFLPAALLPGAPAKGGFQARLIAVVLSLITVWLLARSSLAEGRAFLSVGFESFGDTLFLVLYPFAVLILMIIPASVLADALRILHSRGLEDTSHRYPQPIPLRPRLRFVGVALGLSAGCLGFLALEVSQFIDLGFGFNLAATRGEIFLAPHPFRTVLFATVMYLLMESSQRRLTTRHGATPLTPSEASIDEPETADPTGGPDWYWIIYGLVVATGFAWGAWRFGLVDALIVTLLFGLVIGTSIRAPHRMIQIAGTVLILITGAYAINLLAWSRAALEGLA